jgi:hypothetical protein
MTIAHPFAQTQNAKEWGTQEPCKLLKSNLLNMFNFSLDEVETQGYSCFEHVQHFAREENSMNTANNLIVATYLLYLMISVALTIWVARTLHKRGGIFLVDAFHGNAELADSVNHLLVVGFYLINIGFVSLALKTAATINTSRAAIELLSDKMGMVLLILGGMHFFNLYVFSRIRRNARGPRGPVAPNPPVAPDAVLKVAIPR